MRWLASTALALASLASGHQMNAMERAAEPMITPAPHPRDVLHAFRRQAADQTKTCGFINGVLSSAITCNPGYACAHDDFHSVFGCCTSPVEANNCLIWTTCVDSTAFSGFANTMETLYCNQASAPYCQEYSDSDLYTAFACGVSRAGYFLAFTASGANGDSSVTVAAPVAVTVTASVSSAPTDTSSPPTGSASGGLSTGAIVGIAVGCAVGGLLLLAVAGYFIWRCVRKPKPTPPPHSGGGPATGMQQSTATHVPSEPITIAQHAPLSPENLNSHLAHQWDGLRPAVAQKQSVVPGEYYGDDDGLGGKPELRPQDAAGEPDDSRTAIFSEAGRTAAHPASEAVWHQPV